MSVSSIAALPAAAAVPTAATPVAANDATPADAQAPAVRISLSAEAQISLSIVQETKVSVSVSTGSRNAQGGGSADPVASRALSTLEQVAEAQRQWLAALKAQHDGRPAPKAQDADSAKPPAATECKAGADAGPTVQVSVEQDTAVEASLSVGAELDIEA